MAPARHVFPVNATDRLAEAGVHDVVVLAMKAHQVAPVAAELNTLLGPGSVIVTMQNGIPWWYFSKLPGPVREPADRGRRPRRRDCRPHRR